MGNSTCPAVTGFDFVNELIQWQLKNNQLQLVAQTISGQNVRLMFEPVSEYIWHYTFYPQSQEKDLLTPIVKRSTDSKISITLKDFPDKIFVKGAWLQLEIQKKPWTIRFLEKNGQEICGENPGDMDGLGNFFNLPLGFAKDGENITSCVHSFHLHPDEHLYGLGEKFTRLDKVGQKIISWNVDALGSTSERSHKNIPILLSSRGYGIFINSYERIVWELGTVTCQSYIFSVSGDHLDVYLIFGPKLSVILKRYVDLCGHAALPPKWSFGLWLSSTGQYRDQAAMEKLVNGLKDHQIPADVIHLDTWWMRWRKYCDFQWDDRAFPDHQNFIKKLHQQDLKLSLWMQPYISIESELFEIGKRLNYFVKRADGEVYVIDYGLSLAPRPDGIIRTAGLHEGWNAPVAIIDLTNPAALQWFQDLMRPVLREGVDAFKTDFGEDIPENSVFNNGQSGKSMHNLYALLYNQAVYEVIRQEKGYGLVWSRSAFTGSQRYPVCWSGDPAADWDSLAATIRGGLSIGMSGIPFWSHDIGGYRGMPSAELYVRWLQFGLFSSHSRLHGDSPREPWYFGEKILKISRKFIVLRYQLFPYIFSTAYEATRNGLPVIQAMPLSFPNDLNIHDKDLQYMFGPSLLVAPVYRPDNRRAVYLPSGRWIDFFSLKEYQGPLNLNLKVPLERLPIFIRGGAILPLMKQTDRIPDKLIDPLILQIYPGNLFYVFNEDEGTSKFKIQQNPVGVTFSINSPVQRSFILKFMKVNRPHRILITVNGKKVKLFNDDIIQFRNYLQLKLPKFQKAIIKIKFK
jgi:alpha-D-xyloside xylohydrolase